MCFLQFIRACFCVTLVCVYMCSVTSWLFWFSCQYLLSDSSRKPIPAKEIISTKLRLKSAYDFFWLSILFYYFSVL